MTFFTESEMAALRGVAESAMATSVAIWRRTTERTANGRQDVWAYSTTVDGMLFTSLTPAITQNAGQMATVGSLQLRLPVGTVIRDGDHAVISGKTYIVSDVASDDTWSAMLRCSLRIAD